jgi:hypothetical protein
MNETAGVDVEVVSGRAEVREQPERRPQMALAAGSGGIT